MRYPSPGQGRRQSYRGELGDATDRLVAMLDASIAPPAQQVRLVTHDRAALANFPIPAYHLVRLDK